VPEASRQVPFDEECFFITPIGEEGSDQRRRADGVLRAVVGPAAAEVGLTAVRADHIGEPGQITLQIIRHVLGAKAAVADLTGANPNVYYELAVRHTAKLPTVLIAEDGERLPFDIAAMRTIFFAHTDLNSAMACKDEIVAHLRRAFEGAVDSPIATSFDLQSLEQGGSAVERTLADLVNAVADLSREVQRPQFRNPTTPAPEAIHDLDHALDRLSELAESDQNEELLDLVRQFQKPVRYLSRRYGRSRSTDEVEIERVAREAAEQTVAELQEARRADARERRGAGRASRPPATEDAALVEDGAAPPPKRRTTSGSSRARKTTKNPTRRPKKASQE